MTPIEELVLRYQASLTYRCDCGEEGCPGEVVPSSHDPRVMGMVLGACMLVMADLVETGRREEADALVNDCASYVRQCSAELDDRDYGLDQRETGEMLERFFREPVVPVTP